MKHLQANKQIRQNQLTSGQASPLSLLKLLLQFFLYEFCQTLKTLSAITSMQHMFYVMTCDQRPSTEYTKQHTRQSRHFIQTVRHH